MSIRREIPPMLHLALPLVAAEVGWMIMGIVDTIMVGHLPDSAISLGAAALGQVMYHTVAFGLGGVLLGLDTVLSHAYGGKRIDDANRSLQHGLLLGAIPHCGADGDRRADAAGLLASAYRSGDFVARCAVPQRAQLGAVRC